MKFAWWLELIITCFITYPRIRLLDEWTHTFEVPLFPKAALGTLDTWVKAGSDNRAMPRSVWQDLAAIQGRAPRVCLPSDNGPGREIVYPGALYPNSAEHVSYDETDFLQVEGDIVLACPADLKTNSAALRYVLREWGIESVFSLRPKVGEMLTIPPDFFGGLFALHDTPNTALNGQGIRTDPFAHSGPRETYLLVGQSVPCPSEHVRGYWYSCGFTQPRVCVNIEYRAGIALSLCPPLSPLTIS